MNNDSHPSAVAAAPPPPNDAIYHCATCGALIAPGNAAFCSDKCCKLLQMVEAEAHRRYDRHNNDWIMERLAFIEAALWALSAKASPATSRGPCATCGIPPHVHWASNHSYEAPTPAVTPATQGASDV